LKEKLRPHKKKGDFTTLERAQMGKEMSIEEKLSNGENKKDSKQERKTQMRKPLESKERVQVELYREKREKWKQEGNFHKERHTNINEKWRKIGENEPKWINYVGGSVQERVRDGNGVVESGKWRTNGGFHREGSKYQDKGWKKEENRLNKHVLIENTNTIRELGKGGKVEECMRIFREGEAKGIYPDVVMYGVLMKALEENRQVEMC
jgi:pentatricopeptide repeat protein